MHSVVVKWIRLLHQSERPQFLRWTVVAALAIRLAVALVYGDLHHPKMYEHGEIAHNLYQGRGFTMHWPYEPIDSARRELLNRPIDHAGAFIPPLNPILIYGSYLLFGETPTAVAFLIVLQALLGALAVPLIFHVARSFASEVSARIVSVLGACYLPAAMAVTTFSGSAVYHLAALGVFFLAMKVIDGGRGTHVIGLGLVAGALTMLRSEFLLLAAVLILAAVLVSRSPWVRAHRVRAIAGVLVPFVLIITPWTVRNYLLFDRFVPVVSHPWFEIWRGNNDLVANASFAQPTYVWVNPHDFPSLIRSMDSIPYDRHFEPAVNDLFHAEATRFIRSEPGSFVRLALKKLLCFFTVDLSDAGARSPAYLLMTIPLIALVIVGSYHMVADRSLRRTAVLPLLVGGYYAALTVMTYTLPRYQIFLVVLMLPVGAVALDRLLRRFGATAVKGAVRA